MKREKIKQPNDHVRETAHLNTDRKKYEENFDKIFGKKKDVSKITNDKFNETLLNETSNKSHPMPEEWNYGDGIDFSKRLNSKKENEWRHDWEWLYKLLLQRKIVQLNSDNKPMYQMVNDDRLLYVVKSKNNIEYQPINEAMIIYRLLTYGFREVKEKK